ncbi:hypothetical protein FACS189468_9470 [Spirochaetia bacterium]|nr:hypothetical protein FACS189468_9470 [Spirochaetia bacterium]
MNKPIKALLSITCIAGIFLSAGITGYRNITASRNVFGEWLAPVYVNVEIDKDFADKLSIYSASATKQYYTLSTRQTNTNSDTIKNIELYTQLNITDFHRKVYLCMPQDVSEETIDAIDNLSIFIGNKLCYYSHADIQNFAAKNEGENTLFYIPDEPVNIFV